MNLPVADVESALGFYERIFAFRVESRNDGPPRAAVLARDDIRIALVENGGDPTQEGCFFEVDDVEAAFAELQSNGLGKESADYRVEQHGDKKFRLFFVVAPDGLCYCLGEVVP